MTKQTTKPKITHYRMKRAELNISQSAFWNRIGLTQSAGSRYESKGKVPAPTQTLLDLAYGPKGSAIKLLAELRGVAVEELMGAAKLAKK